MGIFRREGRGEEEEREEREERDDGERIRLFPTQPS
jgi:hypothetical protein